MRYSTMLLAVLCAATTAIVNSQSMAREPRGDFYVATDGSDQNPGTLSSPFLTIERAREAVRERIDADLDADVTVFIRGGTYRISGPIEFSSDDSGTDEHSITYAAFPGETPTISGGRSIQGWRPGPDGTLEADLPDVRAGKWRFRELFVGGERRPRARHPDEGYLRVEKAGPDRRTSFTFSAGDVRAYRDLEEVELVFLHDWSISRVSLQSVDEATRTLTVANSIGPASRHFAIDWFEPHPRYFLENSASFLDQPGEWWLDTRKGRLHYRPLPGETAESLDAVAPVVAALLYVRGDAINYVKNLRFVGLTLEHCAWGLPEKGYAAGQAGFHERRIGGSGALRESMPAAVRFEMAEACRFENGHVAHVGLSGISFGTRCRNCALVGSVISDISGNGVMVGEDRSRPFDGEPWWRKAPTQVSSGNRIENNIIERCGRQFFGAVGVWVGIAEKTSVAHNVIRHHPYTGVSVGWMWSPTPTPCKANVVEWNHIHQVMQTLSDGGGIYTLGRQPGTVLRGNLIHDVPLNLGRAESNGMFIDEGSTDLVIEENVIYAIDRSPLRFHRATTNLVRNNVLVVEKEMPAFRYNNTKAADIAKEKNTVAEKLDEKVLTRARERAGLEARYRHLLTSPPENDEVTVVKAPAPVPVNPFWIAMRPLYVSNREPLVPTPLIKLPVGSIRPRGWLRKQLELQARGFHGHLGDISRFLRKEGNAWLSPAGEGSHGWEEPPYWLKGYLNLAYVLRDEAMIAESKVWIEAALRSQKEDGWFGPDRGRSGLATRLRGREDLWPNMIMLFCLQDYHEATGDERVIRLMARYFKYLGTVPEERFLVGYWPRMRGGDLLFSVYWLYNRTGEKSLLDLAKKVHRRTADWSSDLINWHNVNISQAFGQPTTHYMQSKDAAHLEASYRNYAKIRDLYGQVPGGMFGSDENCREGYTDPRQAVETCGMAEMMLSTETLTWITGDLTWADRCEDVAFNSLPAALTADLKALRYLTSPNMVLSDRHSKSPGLQNGGPMLHMNPHDHRCCQHNWGHGWPYYAEHLWFATPDRGLAAVFYSSCEVKGKVGGGTEVTVRERTRYPFSDTVEFVVETPKAVTFPLYLRVPGWCDGARVEVDGKVADIKPSARQYIRVEREWRNGDTVELTLPMEIRLRRWEKNHSSLSVDRGPLTYSLKIGEKYVREGGTDEWPAWEIHPTTPWNFGLVVDHGEPASSFQVVEREWPQSDMPFTHAGTPIELRAKGKRIPQWEADWQGLVGVLQPSPVKSKEPTEEITLIPMGAARLRISSFPVIGDGPEAHEWKAPPKPAYRASASHCWGGDTERAIADRLIPKSSGDHSIPRHTWWDHRGTKEWVQADFDAPKEISRVEIYWFDDTGRGQCRVPASWRILHRKGDKTGKWVPVEEVDRLGVDKDRFNRATFRRVTTDAVRIEVQLRENVSGGVLELKIE